MSAELEEGLTKNPLYRILVRLMEEVKRLEGRITILETGDTPCPYCHGQKKNLCGTCSGTGVLKEKS
jgi:hypothetical protein